MQKKIKIFGIPFANTTLKDASSFIINQIEKGKKGYICTPNPEMLLVSQKNLEFKKVLQNSMLNIPDGIGILWASTHIFNKSSKLKALLTLPLVPLYPSYFKRVLRERVTGADLLQTICKNIAKKNINCFFLGASSGVAKNAAKVLKKKYPRLSISGIFSGSPREEEMDAIVNMINKYDTDILFVAYGAPAQEIWISKAMKKLKSVKIAIGIGGTFDFIAGKRRRSPRWMQKLGLEWLYRLIQEPSRWKRIYNATIKFPFEVISSLNEPSS